MSRMATIAKIVREAVSEIESKGFKTITLSSQSTRAGGIKTSALGSAMIANGLEGGEFRELVETLEIRNSMGSIFDFIYPPVDISDFIF